MNKEELKQKLESKKFNDTTIEFLTNAINDVEKLYGEYISEETILERIKQNLNCDIEFMDDSENRTVGEYFSDLKSIKLKKRTPEEEHQTFLHEFLHCISTHKMPNGKVFIGFKNNRVEAGINEAMTQYLTEQKYPKSNKSYQEIKNILQKILEIIPREEMIKSYLYGEPEIEELIEKYGMNSFELIYNFDILLKTFRKESILERINFKNLDVIAAKQEIILEYVKGYCNSKKIEEIDIEELMDNVNELERIIECEVNEKSDFDYMQYINQIIAQKLQKGIDEEKLKQLPIEYINRINQQRAKEKIYNKTRKRILDEDFSNDKDTYSDFLEDSMYMNKLIQKICGEGTIFEDEQMRFNLATKLWNEIKSRYPDVDFDWIDFGFLDDKYIIARIDGRIIGAMNIDVYDENEYLKYKEVVESGKNSRRYRIISKENEYIDLNDAQNEGKFYQDGKIVYESESFEEGLERLKKLYEKEKNLKILKDMGAPDVVLKGCEEEIEKLLHPKVKEKKYSIKYAGSYLENQKNKSEIDDDEYINGIYERDIWLKNHIQESSVDENER